MRAHVAFASGFGSDAPALLMNAARGLEPFDLSLARETYLAAWGAAEMSGSLGRGILLEICHAVQALPPPTGAPLPLDLLLDGCRATDHRRPRRAAPTCSAPLARAHQHPRR